MHTFESFSLYVLLCVLAPLIGAFTLLFLIIFEKRIDLLQNQTRKMALEQDLQKALYNQLNQQIQPHFFFNTLNIILSLARLDRKKDLIRSIEVLSKFLKFKYRSLESLIPIEEELKYTEYYLEIQKLRFGDRLSYHINVPTSLMCETIIPFLIQTLVENAFKHSFERYAIKARLKIEIFEEDNKIHLNVWNSSLSEREELLNSEGGVGLENIKQRLELLYSPEDISLQIVHELESTSVLAKWPRKKKNDPSHKARIESEGFIHEHSISR
ncbi:sensor histidine kinase [Peribacillus alkalitolerans]|uniref:sensor histidine kinase n=1 Tax=Peribacillus alkalitolerans TaxID=1550385 RepID=UPI0013D1DD27|nr:histidine kinase [Peribacillus alkalitolerans]